MHLKAGSTTARSWSSKPFALALAVCAIAALLLAGAQGQAGSQARAQSTHLNWTYGTTRTTTIGPGKRMPGLLTGTSGPKLTPQQVAARQAQIAAEQQKLAHLPRPLPHHIAPVSAAIAPTTLHPLALPAKQATPGGPRDGDGVATVELNSNLASGICPSGCAATNYEATSVAGNGKYLFAAGNTFAAYSLDGGSSWTQIDVSSIDPDFCCYQQVLYEPARNWFLWMWQDFDFSSSGSGNSIELLPVLGDLGADCPDLYTITSDEFGFAADQQMDNPDIQYGTDYTYLTWDTYTPDGTTFEGSVVARVPTDSLASCSSLTFNYLVRTDVETFALVSGSTEALNFSSQWCITACTAGSQMEFYNWPESGSKYGILTLNINPYQFDPGEQSCASADNVVTNWCFNAESVRGAAYESRSGYRGFGGQVIGFAWNAAADPKSGFPYPYVVRNYFILPTMTYKGSDAIFSTKVSAQFPNCADSPFRGYVACSLVVGGGDVASDDTYPSQIATVEDKQYPTAPWMQLTLCAGQGNSPYNIWGNYTVTRSWSDDLHWLQGVWCMSNNSGGVTSSFAILGLERDHGAFLNAI